MEYLNAHNITIQYGYRPLVSQVSLALNAGEKVALTGVNGSGKTSLLKVLAGLSRPQEGKVSCFQEEIWPFQQVSWEHKCLFLSHTPSLFLSHCVIWNLDFYCRSYFIRKTEKEYQEALKKFGLNDKAFIQAEKLSTGQKRRLTFAALFLIQPNIVLADEPTNGLDKEGLNLYFELFETLTDKNQTAVLVATHDEQIIARCNRSIALENFQHKSKQKKMKIEALL
jgi:heme ABC exporter ATP-binding subunit CcmA